MPGRLHLGYRKKSKDQPGTWLARRYVGNERYRIAPLGIADDFQNTAISYEAAQQLAYEHRFEVEEHEPRIELTVAETIARYVAWLKLHRATGPEVEQRAALHILNGRWFGTADPAPVRAFGTPGHAPFPLCSPGLVQGGRNPERQAKAVPTKNTTFAGLPATPPFPGGNE